MSLPEMSFQRWGQSAPCGEIKPKEEGLERILPKTLNFEGKRGEDKNDNNAAPKKDGAPQQLKSVNPGDEKTEVDALEKVAWRQRRTGGPKHQTCNTGSPATWWGQSRTSKSSAELSRQRASGNPPQAAHDAV